MILFNTKTKSQNQQNSLQKGRRNGYLFTILVAIALGLVAQFQALGLMIIVVWAIVVVLRRIPAKTSFVLAMLSLGVSLVTVSVGQWKLGENFAAYSFLFLLVATLGLWLEQWQWSLQLRHKNRPGAKG